MKSVTSMKGSTGKSSAWIRNSSLSSPDKRKRSGSFRKNLISTHSVWSPLQQLLMASRMKGKGKGKGKNCVAPSESPTKTLVPCGKETPTRAKYPKPEPKWTCSKRETPSLKSPTPNKNTSNPSNKTSKTFTNLSPRSSPLTKIKITKTTKRKTTNRPNNLSENFSKLKWSPDKGEKLPLHE